MSFLLAHSVAIQPLLGQVSARSGEQTEQEFFQAKGAEIARRTRRQRLARMTAALSVASARVMERLTRASREEQHRKNLLEKLENMPAYLLKDIDVTRDDVGSYCYRNDFGMLVELAANDRAAKPKGKTRMEGRLVAYAAQ